jgi:hypothetical protein
MMKLFRPGVSFFFFSAFLFLCLLPSCAGSRPSYLDEVPNLAFELAATDPSSPEAVFHFATLRSCNVRLDLPGITEEIVRMMMEEGPWYEKLLFAYLLALKEDREGFEAILELLEAWDLPTDLKDGLVFCGMKYLGMAEAEKPLPVVGWEADLGEWESILERIEEMGLQRWRLEYLKEIVLSGDPASGEKALDGAAWLRWKLRARDVPFLADLLEKGSPTCDVAVLNIIETILMQTFRPEGLDGNLERGMRAYREWYETNAALSPDQWMTRRFVELGCEVEDLYNQAALPELLSGLFDESKDWVMIRSHTLSALNRISGLHVDRKVIFLEKEVRQKAAEAFQCWYQEMADAVRLH